MVFLLNIWENILFLKMVFIIYNTRLSSKGAFVIPKVKSHGLKSFCYNGCSLWNSLTHAFSEISNMSHFEATSDQQFLTIYSAIYRFFLSTVIYLFACYLSINYIVFLNHNSVYFIPYTPLWYQLNIFIYNLPLYVKPSHKGP